MVISRINMTNTGITYTSVGYCAHSKMSMVVTVSLSATGSHSLPKAEVTCRLECVCVCVYVCVDLKAYGFGFGSFKMSRCMYYISKIPANDAQDIHPRNPLDNLAGTTRRP